MKIDKETYLKGFQTTYSSEDSLFDGLGEMCKEEFLTFLDRPVLELEIKDDGA